MSSSPPPPGQYGTQQPTQYGAPPAYYPQPPVKQSVSNLWYVAPILFAILGGAVAWFVNKDKDPQKARSFLIVGVAMTVVNIILMYY